MGKINDFFAGVKKAIPEIAKKIGAFLLAVFFIGMLFGYFIAGKGPDAWLWLLFVPISIIITWYKLDEGMLVFLLILVAAFLI